VFPNARYLAYITDPTRAAVYEPIFGGRYVPVISDVPHLVVITSLRAAIFAYRIDLSAIDDDQRARLVAHLAARHHEDPDAVNAVIDAEGIAIAAQDCLAIPADLYEKAGGAV
jgi:hypothetical protein